MTWKRAVNRTLARTTGLELRRAGTAAPRPRVPGDRLITAPTFILCTVRSGSTLLRVLLNSHSQIHAPHELHLRYVSVKLERRWSEQSMEEMGLDERSLRHLLWYRLLHRQLAASGKRFIVDKTPNNVFIADELKACWPDARFIFLLRHPAMIARSRKAFRGDSLDEADNADWIRRYCQAVEDARQTYEGHTVRYEDLTEDPHGTTREICRFLGVRWEPGMLDYGRHKHGRLKFGLGDWTEKIKSGEIRPAEPPPPPEEIPEVLRPICTTWGYLPAETATSRSTA